MPSIAPARARLFALSLGLAALAACSEESTGTKTSTASTEGTGGSGAATATGGSGGSGASGGATTASSGGNGGGGGSTTSSTSSTTEGQPCGAFAQRHGGDTAADTAQLAGAVVDAAGGAIVAANIAGTVKVGGQALASAGGSDVMLMRLGDTGEVLWAKRFGSVFDDQAKSIAAVASGGAVVVGTFDGAVDFDGTTLTSTGGPDAFVLRIDADGDLKFVLQFANADARSVSINSGGDILIAGDFKGMTTFGEIALTSDNNDAFVVRITEFGDVAVAQQYAFDAKPGAIAIAAGTGRSYLAGSFQGVADFGTGPITSAGSKDVFLARLDPSLAPQLVRRFGDDTSQEVRAVAVLPDGSAAIAGAFRGTLDFDGATLVADTQDDAFVARLDDNGSVLFALRFGDAAEQSARSIAVDSGGGLLVAGGFQGTIDAGDGPLTSAGGEDVFLTWLDPMGMAVKTQRWGAAGDQRARAVSADPCGAVLLGGDFTGTLPWDGTVLTAGGGLDLFLARLAP